jgi:peptide/nickel transport system ATP-binding protein
MTALNVRNLTITLGDKKLVHDLSFEIEAQGRLGLIGESGSGKSLTALAIMGLLPEQMRISGSILLKQSYEVIGSSERALNSIRGNHISVIFQEPLTALDPLMPVGKQISKPLRRRGLRGNDLSKAVNAAISEVAIQNPERVSKALPHQISGGERQRISIAMALACQPDLLIADEPTTALDVTVQAEILELLNFVVTEHKAALLFISHDLAVVSKISDSVLLLKDGVQIEAGSLRSIIKDPQTEYSRDLVSNARKLDQALTSFGKGF